MWNLVQPPNPPSPLQTFNASFAPYVALTGGCRKPYHIQFGRTPMALSLAKAAPLKPEIKLAQALSEFQAILNDDQKTKLRNYRGQSPPSSTDVMKFTAEIDWHASRNRKSRRCVGTRLTNVLHAVQQFSNVVDVVVGSSQSHIAGLIWGTVKLSLQVIAIFQLKMYSG